MTDDLVNPDEVAEETDEEAPDDGDEYESPKNDPVREPGEEE